MLYAVGRTLGLLYLHVIPGFRVIGRERVPNKGRLIVVANHASNLDPVALGCAMPRPVYFMAKSELFQNWFSRAVMRGVHAFPVERGKPDRQAYRSSMEVLQAEKVLGIFPEGTRSKTGELQTAHPGAAQFAILTDTRVLPVAIVGTGPVQKGKATGYGRPRVRVIFGEPIEPPTPKGARVTREEIQGFANDIMMEIGRLAKLA